MSCQPQQPFCITGVINGVDDLSEQTAVERGRASALWFLVVNVGMGYWDYYTRP